MWRFFYYLLPNVNGIRSCPTGCGAVCFSMMLLIIGLHLPHPVPAPVIMPTSPAVDALFFMACTISFLLTILQRHIISSFSFADMFFHFCCACKYSFFMV